MFSYSPTLTPDVKAEELATMTSHYIAAVYTDKNA